MNDYTGNSDTAINIWLNSHFHGYLSQRDASCKDEWIVRLYDGTTLCPKKRDNFVKS